MLCLLVLAVMQSRPEDGDGRGQCSVVQEAPALGTVGWGLNAHSVNGAASGKSQHLRTSFSPGEIKKIESTRVSCF